MKTGFVCVANIAGTNEMKKVGSRQPLPEQPARALTEAEIAAAAQDLVRRARERVDAEKRAICADKKRS